MYSLDKINLDKLKNKINLQIEKIAEEKEDKHLIEEYLQLLSSICTAMIEKKQDENLTVDVIRFEERNKEIQTSKAISKQTKARTRYFFNVLFNEKGILEPLIIETDEPNPKVGYSDFDSDYENKYKEEKTRFVLSNNKSAVQSGEISDESVAYILILVCKTIHQKIDELSQKKSKQGFFSKWLRKGYKKTSCIGCGIFGI